MAEEPAEDATPSAASDETGVGGLRGELEQEHDRYLRTRADFENYRRRVERDRDAAARLGKRELLEALVDLADGFDRALAHIGESPDAVAAGLHGMQRRLSSVLRGRGGEVVRERRPVLRPDSPRSHRHGSGRGQRPGTVVDETGNGYMWKDELLRPARVRVAE